MGIEFLGASIMVFPDLPLIKQYLAPSALSEGRRELFDISSVMRGSEEYDAILSIVEEEWDGDLRQEPAFFLIEKPQPGVPKSLFAIYDEDSDGPYGDLMDGGEAQRVPEEFEDMGEYIWENDRWDAICSKQIFDEWVSGKEDSRANREIYTRGLGFALFLVGFGIQFL